jgi:hypothetical protein
VVTTQQMMEFLLKMEADRKAAQEETMAKLDANQKKLTPIENPHRRN